MSENWKFLLGLVEMIIRNEWSCILSWSSLISKCSRMALLQKFYLRCQSIGLLISQGWNRTKIISSSPSWISERAGVGSDRRKTCSSKIIFTQIKYFVAVRRIDGAGENQGSLTSWKCWHISSSITKPSYSSIGIPSFSILLPSFFWTCQTRGDAYHLRLWWLRWPLSCFISG